MGGWWRADGSAFCAGPRYYMDCNALCRCATGCGDGFPFCEPGCDETECGCGGGDCNRWAVGCFQFRYGQCNQDVPCMGRIVCRVVSCVPPWEIDPSCTTTNAQDDFTANMNEPCNTSVPAPPPGPCGSPLTACEAVGIAATPSGRGYHIATAFGRVLSYGDARADGDATRVRLSKPIVAVAAHPDGGYWLAAADGGVFAFGAAFHGAVDRPLDRPVVAMVASPTGRGYWLAATDGGIFAFGDAGFHGSMGGRPLSRPIVGLAATATGRGYWLVAADGGIFAFGDAGFHGSMGGRPLARPVVAMAPTPTGKGYWLIAADGGIFAFGDAGFHGSMGGRPLEHPVVGRRGPDEPRLLAGRRRRRDLRLRRRLPRVGGMSRPVTCVTELAVTRAPERAVTRAPERATRARKGAGRRCG